MPKGLMTRDKVPADTLFDNINVSIGKALELVDKSEAVNKLTHAVTTEKNYYHLNALILPQRIEPGTEPDYTMPGDWRNVDVVPEEWAIKLGFTRTFLEDHTSTDVATRTALATKSMIRFKAKEILNAIWDFDTAAPVTLLASFSTVDLASEGLRTDTAHVVDDGGTLTLSHIDSAVAAIREHDLSADTLYCKDSDLDNILGLMEESNPGSAGTQTRMVPSAENLTGGAVKFFQKYTIRSLIVETVPWLPANTYIVADATATPVAVYTKREITLEEAVNGGFGIIGSYISMRFGTGLAYPEAVAVIYDAP